MENLGAVLFVQLIAVVIGSVVSAVILRVAAQWVERVDVPFGHAYLTMVLIEIINIGVLYGVVFGVRAVIETGEAGFMIAVLTIPIRILLQAGIISSRLTISFGTGCMIALVMIGIGFGIAVAIAIPLVLLMVLTK